MLLTPITLETNHGGQPNDPNFVAGRGYWYRLDHEQKLATVWFCSAIVGGISPYLKLITMILALVSGWTLKFYIHSPGGEIQTCCQIISAIERCQANVIIINMGLAASCGSLILATGHQIAVMPNSTTMFHNAAVGLGGLVHRVIAQTNHTVIFVGKLFQMMLSKGVVTQDEFEAIVKRGEEFYLNSDEMEKRLREAGVWYELEVGHV